MSLLDNFPHRCTIRRRKFAKGSLTGKKTTYDNVQTNVLCWEQAAGDTEDNSYQKEGMRITHKVYFLNNPNVTRRYQILVTYRNGATVSSPIPLDVVSNPMPDATAGLGVVYRVLCREVTSEDD
jgi:hypothetical protein